MPSFQVKVQRTDGSIEELTVQSESALKAKQFLRKRGFKQLDIKLSNHTNINDIKSRERDYIATCRLKNGKKASLEISSPSEAIARRELRKRGHRVLKIELAKKQISSTN